MAGGSPQPGGGVPSAGPSLRMESVGAGEEVDGWQKVKDGASEADEDDAPPSLLPISTSSAV